MPSLATLGDELLVGVCVLWPIVGADARSISQLPAHDDFRRSALPLRLVNRKLGALATDQAFGSFTLSPTGCHLSHIDAFVVWPRVAKHIRSFTARNMRKYDQKGAHEASSPGFDSIANALLAACPQLVELYIDAEQSILSSIANLELPHLRTLGLAYPTTISHHVKPAFDIIYLAPAVLGQPGLTKLILYDMRAGASDSTATFQALRSHPTLQQIELQRCTIGDHQTSPGPAAYAPIIRPRELGTLISDGSPSMAVAVALAFSPRSLVLTGPGAAGDVALGCARRSALRFVHLSREGQTLLPTLANNPSITTLSLGLIVDPYSHHDHGGFGRAIATQISADGALHGLKRVVFRVAPAVLASEATREGFFVGTALSIRAAAVLRGVKWAMVADDVDWSTYIQRCEDERLYEPTAAAVSPEPYSPASPAHISAPSPTSSIAEDDLMAQ